MHREVWLEEAQCKTAGRRTGTPSEVWYIRDELARDNKSSICDWDVLYKWSVYAVTVQCLTLGDLSSVQG